MGQPKILVVEDHPEVQEKIKAVMAHKALLLQAYTQKEAVKLFRVNPDVGIVIMDGMAPEDEGGETVVTTELVKKIRRKFKGPMVAISWDKKRNEELCRAGCSLKCDKQKLSDLPTVLGF